MKYDLASPIWVTDQWVWRLIRCKNTTQQFITHWDVILPLLHIQTKAILTLSVRACTYLIYHSTLLDGVMLWSSKSWARFPSALAPPLRQQTGLIQINKEAAFFHTRLKSVWTQPFGEPRHPVNEIHFCKYTQSYSVPLSRVNLRVGRSTGKSRVCPQAQFLVTVTVWYKHPHHCRRYTHLSVNLTPHFTLTCAGEIGRLHFSSHVPRPWLKLQNKSKKANGQTIFVSHSGEKKHIN